MEINKKHRKKTRENVMKGLYECMKLVRKKGRTKKNSTEMSTKNANGKL